MAVTSQQIIDFLLANPGMSDAQIVAAMEQYGVSPAQMATAVGLPEGEVVSRVAVTVPQGQTITLGDTIVAPQYRTTGSGETAEIGELETIYTSKTTGDPNYRAPVGSEYQQYGADGTLQRTGVTQKTADSFLGGLVDAFKDPVVLAALGGAAAGGLFGGAGALGGAATVGTTGLTAAEISALTATDLAVGGGALAGTAPLTAAQIAGLTATDLAIGAGTPSAASTAGLLTPAVTSAVVPTVAGTTAASTIPAATAASTAATALTPTAASVLAPAAASALTPTVANIATSLIPTAVKSLFTPTNATNLSNLFSGGLTTAGSLLQQQQSKEAALAAQQRIDAETAAAKQAAAFRPIGMTTRFGTSQFQVDPVTGQLTSAGYTLDPQAKNAQDRLVKLAESGLQQAEGAQAQFAPLQTGAQSLFNLGNQYISQTPQSVAENYLKQQMALLQPGRETELANLQNRLQQQGRGGLSVAQGGTMGATTPELQALFNARAQQEAVLAANAQQAGQQQVAFGAGLLGTGAQTMGNYYAGQQQAYAPYSSALGQVQNLETLAQQPFNMSNALAQQASQAGSRVGQLGLTGAQLSTNLATSANATANPYAQALMAAGNPNAMFGQSLNNVFSGLFGNSPVTAMSAPATSFGSGNYYGNQDLGLYL